MKFLLITLFLFSCSETNSNSDESLENIFVGNWVNFTKDPFGNNFTIYTYLNFDETKNVTLNYVIDPISVNDILKLKNDTGTYSFTKSTLSIKFSKRDTVSISNYKMIGDTLVIDNYNYGEL